MRKITKKPVSDKHPSQLPLKIAGALGGSVLIYSDIECHHLSSVDAQLLADEIKLMAEKVEIES